MYIAVHIFTVLLFRHNMMSTKLGIIIASTVQRTINFEDSAHVFKRRHLSATMGLCSERWCMI